MIIYTHTGPDLCLKIMSEAMEKDIQHAAAIVVSPQRRAAQWALIRLTIAQTIALASTYVGLLKTMNWDSPLLREGLCQARWTLAWVMIPELNICDTRSLFERVSNIYMVAASCRSRRQDAHGQRGDNPHHKCCDTATCCHERADPSI